MSKIIKILSLLIPIAVSVFASFKLVEIIPRETGTITFLDVGQGDAIYIRTPKGRDILIDGGPDESVIRSLAKVMSKTDRNIDVLVMTHSDSDHSSGLIYVMQRFSVDELIVSGATSTSPVRQEVDRVASNEGVYVRPAAEGDVILFNDEPDFKLAVLSPSITDLQEKPNDSNDLSLILHLTYGSSSVMLTGDAGKEIEQEIMSKYYDSAIKSTILKAGHHGSNTSTDQAFVETVSPYFAVISAGADNRYGHPHSDVLKTLSEHSSSTILETKNEGNITFVVDEEKMWLKN